MDNPPPGRAFTKRLWPQGVDVPHGWQVSEELTLLVRHSHPDFVIIVGWFDPLWKEGGDSAGGGL